MTYKSWHKNIKVTFSVKQSLNYVCAEQIQNYLVNVSWMGMIASPLMGF